MIDASLEGAVASRNTEKQSAAVAAPQAREPRGNTEGIPQTCQQSRQGGIGLKGDLALLNLDPCGTNKHHEA